MRFFTRQSEEATRLCLCPFLFLADDSDTHRPGEKGFFLHRSAHHLFSVRSWRKRDADLGVHGQDEAPWTEAHASSSD